MKNKLMATVAVSALAAAMSVAAQADAHPYAGISGGYFKGNADIHDGVASEGTAGLQAGYHFNQDLSLELGHSEGIATRANHVRNVSLTGAYRLLGDTTQLLAVGGLQNINWADSDVEPVLGAAVSHYFTDNIEMRATVLGGVEDTEYLASSVSLNYHFGTHKEAVVAEPAAEPVAAPAEKKVLLKKTLNAHFANDSAVVRAEDKAEISHVATAMKNNPGSTADLVGHTDSNASDEYNQALSEKRAAAIKDELIRQGASADAITTSGQGESSPVGDNATKEGRAANRRVEATVTGQ
jgi:outer membrane protein OmpA-like peptidoglycan-associated protein